jgi:type IV pilus assembly protein PilO
MGNFASGIAALPRIVTLHDIEIAQSGKDASAGNLVLNVTAKTYRYLDEEEQAPAEAGKKGAKDTKGAKAKKTAKGKKAEGE